VLWAVANAPIETEIQIFPSKSRTVLPASEGAITPRRKSDCEDSIFCPLEKLIAGVKVLPFLACLLLLPILTSAQDRQRECGQSDFPGICSLETAQAWNTGNQVWIFRPIRPDANVIIFIHNNNTGAVHTSQSVQVFQTPFPDAVDLSNNASRWTQATVIQNPTAGATCLSVNAASDASPGAAGTGICYITAAYATQIAIKIIGATGANGANDTFDLQIVQEVSVPQPLGTQNVSIAAGSQIGANVQGVIPQFQNGNPIFPLLNGAYQVAVNQGFTAEGLDNSGNGSFPITTGTSGTWTFPVPTPSISTGFALAFVQGNDGVVVSGPAAPWSCVTSNCHDSFIPNIASLSFSANGGLTPIQPVWTFTNSTQTQNMVAVILDFISVPTVRQFVAAQATQAVFSSNTLAGSVLVAAAGCTTAPANGVCSWSPPTDGQGNTWRLVGSVQSSPGQTIGAVFVWMSINFSSAAAETVTFHPNLGTTTGGSSAIELRGLLAANLTTPSVKLFASNRGFTPNEDDNGGLFVETGGFSISQTLTIGPTTGTSLFPLWQQNEHGVFNSCTMSIAITGVTGTVPTLDLFVQDGGDGIHWNDRMHFPQFTVAGNFLGAIGGGSGGIIPVLTTDGGMAVSTKLDGPLSAFGQLKFVLGGTSPTFTFVFNMVCR